MEESALEVRDLTMDFHGSRALDGLNIAFRQGDVHAVVGENMAGKTTLMKVLNGLHPAGSYLGRILIDGTEQRFRSIKDSERAGITAVFQDFALVKEMSVCENLFLGNEVAARGIIRWQETFSRARAVLSEVGLNVDPVVEIFRLGVIQQLLIGIAKALVKSARFLILDEPSTLLSTTETENLYAVIRRLKAKGLTCIYASKRLNEVFEIADRVTVLRDGCHVMTRQLTEVSQTQIREWMDGRNENPRGSGLLAPVWPAPVAEPARTVELPKPAGQSSEVGALVDYFRKKQGYLKRLAIKSGHVYKVFEANAIDCFKVENGLVFLHVDGGKHLIDLPLSRLDKKLDPSSFYRAHRNAIVNLSRIRQIIPWGRGMYKLEFSDGERVTLSRQRVALFRKMMGLD